mmetsp:Transcript_113399/g.196911  ORF Transcript_113399/g.196911 Transcript_113399/m.196911 type:complete len:97 (+) Transcript_113399:527-817(+)
MLLVSVCWYAMSVWGPAKISCQFRSRALDVEVACATPVSCPSNTSNHQREAGVIDKNEQAFESPNILSAITAVALEEEILDKGCGLSVCHQVDSTA